LIIDKPGYSLGTWIVLEFRQVVEVPVVKRVIYQFSESCFDDTKVDEHPAFAQFFARSPDPHPIIMAMEAFTFAVIVDNSVSRGKFGLNSHIVHFIFLFFVSIISL